MNSVFAAELAILLHFKTLRITRGFAHERIVPLLAVSAFQL